MSDNDELKWANYIKSKFHEQELDGCAYFIKDLDNRYCYMNSKQEEFLKFYTKTPQANFVGENINNLLSSKDIEQVANIDEYIYSTGRSHFQVESYKVGRQELVGINYKMPIYLDNQLVGTFAKVVSINFFNIHGEAAVLSHREQAVLSLWLFGFSAKALARALNIQPRSAESYIERIKVKFQLYSREQIFAHLSSNQIYELSNRAKKYLK